MILVESRQRKRWSINQRWLIAASVAGLIGLGFVVAEPVNDRWRAWRANRAVSRAQAFTKAGDSANALLSITIGMQLAGADVGKLKAIANVLEQIRSPDSVQVYRRIVELAP